MQVMEVPVELKEFVTTESLIVRSPGRINLIGEHTDYNDGFVLPAAIDKSAYLSLTPRNDLQIHLHSLDLKDVYITSVDTLAPSTNSSWPNYLLGVVAQFIKAGVSLNGFNAALTSNIPMGAGLSSSAAIECAMAMALNVLSKANLDKITLAKMAQKAEHEYAGVKCGIMDQFACIMGKDKHVIKLDCSSLQYEYKPFDIHGYKIVLMDTGIKHSLASSEYNVRRKQCETGIAIIQKYNSEIASFRDVSIQMLDEYVLPEDITVYKRCKYVVEENNRLLKACEDLGNRDLPSFGKRMIETHYGLSKLYEVSCPELDFLVSCVEDNPYVLGARMMGGGFGGCTINIVKEEAVDELIANTEKQYSSTMNKKLKAYIVNINDGASVMQIV